MTLRQRGADGYPVGADKLLRDAYGQIPEAELFQHPHMAPQKPTQLVGWDWSVTFGRWSALVEFADGWQGFTYPFVPAIYIEREALDRHGLSGEFFVTQEAKPVIDAIGVDVVLAWFNSKRGSVKVGETRSIGNGLAASFVFDYDKPNGECFNVAIGTEKGLLVIYSPNEAARQDGDGFWSNEHGWGDIESATVFCDGDQTVFTLPLAIGLDAAWMPLATATRGEFHS